MNPQNIFVFIHAFWSKMCHRSMRARVLPILAVLFIIHTYYTGGDESQSTGSIDTQPTVCRPRTRAHQQRVHILRLPWLLKSRQLYALRCCYYGMVSIPYYVCGPRPETSQLSKWQSQRGAADISPWRRRPSLARRLFVAHLTTYIVTEVPPRHLAAKFSPSWFIMFLAFINVKKAFDKVPREKLKEDF